MRTKKLLKSSIILSLVFIFAKEIQVHAQNSPDSTGNIIRERSLMDQDWRFAYGHSFDAGKDFNHGTGYFSYMTKTGYGDGPASKSFDDRTWRIINLPHDWAVELPFDFKAGYSHGYKTIGRNFPETSVGWYRKTFVIPESDLGKRISIEFDGVRRNSIVWVNGFYLGQEHSGYNNFQYDITDYLNYGGENVVAVRVDATMEEGWFYEGAGIYRHAWLEKTSPLHISPYGIFVTSELHDNNADITARTTIINQEDAETTFDIDQTILDADGKPITSGILKQLKLKAGEEKEYFSNINISNPKLWSIETPYLHKLITSIRRGNTVIDRSETTFGIRTLRFDPNEGFFLNGKHVLINGTNNHQDFAGVGAAMPDALQEFRIKRLKEMGCNAYRCSHNPPTPELLDACDHQGMLVLDENRLMGINTEYMDLLKRMIVRDRNHPCIFTWSLGNEEWTIESNVLGARIASTMKAFAHRLDSSRLVTTAIDGGCGNGTSTVLDVMGFNYLRQCDIDEYHKKFPNQPGMGTEETTSRGTRGIYVTDSVKAYLMATDRAPSGWSIEKGLQFYAARPFLAGLFFWTGFDYRGEPAPYGWPQVSSQCGIMDICGFPKDQYYYLKSWWTDEPVLHLLPHWNWKSMEGKAISVWAYSNCEEVELFLNNKSLGRKTMLKNAHLEWMVNYEPGTLLARGYKNGKEIITDKVETTSEPAVITLIPDRTSIKANGKDVSVITVQVNDPEGRCVPKACNEISFTLQGPGKIIGEGNGDPSSHEPDKFIEEISQIRIENLKAKLLSSKDNYPESAVDFNDSNWPPMTDEQGNYNVKAKDSLKTAVIRGTFSLPGLTDSTEISLWPKSLGEVQAIYINGKLIAKSIKRDDAVQKYILGHQILKKGKNIYAVVCTPLVPRYQWDNLNTDPGIIRVYLPAGIWKRRAFNGLAQVIVQSKNQAGEIKLKATSPGLSEAVTTILSNSVSLQPKVNSLDVKMK